MRQNLLSKEEIEYIKRQKLSASKMPYKNKYRNRILEKIVPIKRFLNDVLTHTHNIPKEKFYNEFNAQSLYEDLSSLLSDCEKDQRFRREAKYDFRTIELARIKFELTAEYLKRSPIFKNNSAIKGDIERVQQHFLSLSEHGLQIDVHRKDKEESTALTQEDEEKLEIEFKECNKKLTAIYQSEKFLELSNKEMYLHGEQTRIQTGFLQKQLYDISSLKLLKKKSVKKIKTKENKKILRESSKVEERVNSIESQIEKLQEQIKSLFESDVIKARRIREKLLTRYEHLKPYSCPLNPLSEFQSTSEQFFNELYNKKLMEVKKYLSKVNIVPLYASPKSKKSFPKPKYTIVGEHYFIPRNTDLISNENRNSSFYEDWPEIGSIDPEGRKVIDYALINTED